VSSGSIELAKHVLLAFGIILALGTASAVLAQKLKVPDVVVFLLIGMLLGPGFTGVIDIRADSAVNQLVLIFGSCYILFDGALRENFRIGSLNPGTPDPDWLIRSDSITELALECGHLWPLRDPA